MDAENKPVENVTEAVSPAANDKSAARWVLILQVLCAAGVLLVIGILVLQFTEYRFYKAPPDVWPQPGAGGTVSAPAVLPTPAALAAPLSPVTSTIPSTPPVPSAIAASTGVTSAAVVAATSAPAPVAATP